MSTMFEGIFMWQRESPKEAEGQAAELATRYVATAAYVAITIIGITVTVLIALAVKSSYGGDDAEQETSRNEIARFNNIDEYASETTKRYRRRVYDLWRKPKVAHADLPLAELEPCVMKD